MRERYGFCKEVASHLVSSYGTRALQVAEMARAAPELGARLSARYPFIAAEVAFAVEQEYALTLADVLARRARLAFLNADEAAAAAPAAADVMAPLLGWSPAQRAAELTAFAKFVEGMHA